MLRVIEFRGIRPGSNELFLPVLALLPRGRPMRASSPFLAICLGALLAGLPSTPWLQSAEASPVFGPAVSYGTAQDPLSVVIGDWNQDGGMDLAVAAYTPGVVSVLLGAGDGTFGAKTDFGAGPGSYSLAAGDADGDGALDLVVANREGNTVSVLLGNGDGTFAAKTDYVTATGPVSVVLGDVNGDAALDIVTANIYSSTVSVLLGAGNGTFGSKADFGTGSQPIEVAMGDLNGDGSQDLAVAPNNSLHVTVLLGNGDGTFAPAVGVSTGPYPRGVAIADLNGDGHRDLIVGKASSNLVAVLLGNGDGTFAPRTDYDIGGYAYGPRVADLDRDGTLDLAAPTNGWVSIFRGNGDGTVGARSDYGAGGSFLGIEDLNGDTWKDLALVKYPSSVNVMLNVSDRAPTVEAPVSVVGMEGSPLAVTVTASDPDGDAIASLTGSPLPSGASFVPGPGNTSGTLSWTPSLAQIGAHSVTFTAMNALSGSATTLITVTDTWGGNGTPVGYGADTQEMPQIIADGAGGAIVSWTDYRNGNADVFAQRVDASGAPLWGPNGAAVCKAPGDQLFTPIIGAGGDGQRAPEMIPDGAGGAIVTWYDTRFGNRDIFAQRISAFGEIQWDSLGVALCAAPGDQNSPQIASDGSGGAIVAWSDTRPGVVDVVDIYAQRVDASGSAVWGSDGVAVCSATGYQNKPMLIADGTGGAILTWYDSRSGNYDIYTQFLDAAGNALWGTNGISLCTAPGDQRFPQITPDGAGGAVVAWQDYRPTSGVYAQRVTAGGVVLWETDGTPVCTAPGEKKVVQIVSDGAGGAITAWSDSRASAGNANIYAQRVNSSGATVWITDGVQLCTAQDAQVFPHLVSDGSGGAIAIWDDYRALGGNWDIYAQRVDRVGNVQWPFNGAAVCAAAAPQHTPYACPDGVGGIIAAWQDERAGNNDVYVMRVAPQGGMFPTGVDTPARGGVGTLDQNRPNPFNPQTAIPYTIPTSGRVVIRVFDIDGALVRTLVDEVKPTGAHSARWDGTRDDGQNAASGVYFYQMKYLDRLAATRKMMLLR